MQPSAKTAHILCFGLFEADLRSGELRKNGLKIKLQEQPFQVLAILLQRPGEVVTREELRQRLWSDDTFVDFEHSLGTAIKKIRQVLSDSATNPRFIETLPKRGYRFIAPVEAPAATGASMPESSASAGESSVRKRGPSAKFGIAAVAVFLVLLSAFLISHTPQTQDVSLPRTEGPIPPSRVVPLTSFPGPEWSASWSPDGDFLAIDRLFAGSSDVFIVPRAGGKFIRLTDSPADDFCPRWSPDGRWLAYLSDEGSTKSVYLTPPSGGRPRKLAGTNIPSVERFTDSYRALGTNPWSPEGRELLFSRLQPDGRIALWKIDIETARETPVTAPPLGHDDLLGAWSYDGKSIVFVRRRAGRFGLWLQAESDEEPQPLLVDEFNHTHPVWGPENQRIVFQSNRAGAINLWEVTVSSRRLRQLTTGPGSEMRPIISKHGELAFTQYRQRLGLYLRKLASGEEIRIVDDTRRIYQPRLSPDGNRVVYQSNRKGNFDLWVLDLVSGRERQVTRDPTDDHSPDWSPDGSRIVFFSHRKGTPRLWVSSVNGGPDTPLADLVAPPPQTSGVGVLAGGKWSPDGKVVGYVAPSDKGSALWIVDVETCAAKPGLFGVADFGWYKDRRRIVYTPAASGEDNAPQMKVMNLETGKSRVLLEAPNAELAVAPDGSGVTFVAGPSHGWTQLWLLRLDENEHGTGLPFPAGPPERLTDGDGSHAHNGGWSWDGKSVVYVRDSVEADIYLLEGYR